MRTMLQGRDDHPLVGAERSTLALTAHRPSVEQPCGRRLVGGEVSATRCGQRGCGCDDGGCECGDGRYGCDDGSCGDDRCWWRCGSGLRGAVLGAARTASTTFATFGSRTLGPCHRAQRRTTAMSSSIRGRLRSVRASLAHGLEGVDSRLRTHGCARVTASSSSWADPLHKNSLLWPSVIWTR